MRRVGDTVEIGGDYQYNALHTGFVVQRFWHALKFTTVDRLLRPGAGMTVLDLACGSGVLSDFLAQSGAEVYAVDANPRAIEFATKKFNRPNLHFQLGLADGLTFPDRSFDAIYMFEFIEHIYWEQVLSLLRILRTKLKEGGRIVITTPNYRSLWPVIELLLDKSGLTPPMAEHQHVCKPTMKKLRELAASTDFEIEHLGRAFGIAPFTSVLGWGLAESIDRLEHRVGHPLGSILCAVFRRS